MLKAPLLGKEIELLHTNDIDSDIIEAFQNYHMFQQENNMNEIQIELIDAMGGIEHILNNCLTSNNILKLNKEQISKVNNIFINNSKEKEVNNDTLYLNQYDTIYRYFCGKSCRNKLVNLVIHKYSLITMTIILLIGIIFNIMSFNNRSDVWSWKLNGSYICLAIWIIFMILSILCSNRFIVPYVVSSFEFWIKIIYCFKYSIFHFIHVTSQKREAYYACVQPIGGLFGGLIILTFVSLLDGLNIPRGFKVLYAALVAIYLSRETIEWKIFHPHNDSDVVNLTIFGTTFTLHAEEMIGDSYSILSVFVWKQAIMTLVRKTKTTLLTRGYKIKWLNETDKIQSVYHVQDQVHNLLQK